MGDNVLAGLDFSTAMRDVHAGMIVKPLLHNYLFDASFPAFTMEFPQEQMHRAPDGWFHPSTHPLWPEATLYHYLATPDRLVNEKKDYMGALSITVGKAMHGFVQMCLEDLGIRPAHLQACTLCPPEAGCDEFGLADETVGERGHVDGMLDLSGHSVPAAAENPVWEFKTTNERRVLSLTDMDLAGFRKTWPAYYAQQQSYLRMSGKALSIVVIMQMGYPWTMREFHLPYDRGFSMGVREKYLSVRQAVADQRAPRCCGRVKSCPAGPMICEVA